MKLCMRDFAMQYIINALSMQNSCVRLGIMVRLNEWLSRVGSALKVKASSFGRRIHSIPG